MSLIKKITFYILSFVLITTITAIIFELGSRVIFPISAGAQKFDVDTAEVLSIDFNKPNSRYLQKHVEYEALTTINEHGNRIVASSNASAEKTIIFLGDSFTFGQGVSDRETIAYKVCEKVDANCINLGKPGTGLLNQLRKLEEFLKTEGDPLGNAHLFHFILASTKFSHAGNDIQDTANEVTNGEPINSDTTDSPEVSDAGLMVEFARELSRRSNGFRVVRYVVGNWLREFAYSDSNESASEHELKVFAEIDSKIKQLAEDRGLKYTPVLFSTYSELELGQELFTQKALEEALEIQFLMIDYPTKDYGELFYPLDGHHNSNGAAVVATSIVNYLN
jgi:hypothetical protein